MDKYKRQLPQDLQKLLDAYEDDKTWLEVLGCATATAVFVLVCCFC